MVKEHQILFVAGLGDDPTYLPKQLSVWRKEGIDAQVYYAPWETHTPFQQKLQNLLTVVDETPYHVDLSIGGISAGSSLAANIFALRSSRLHFFVSVCGLFRTPHSVGYIMRRLQSYPALLESLKMSNQVIDGLSDEERSRVLTLRGFFDEQVPTNISTIAGATNKIIPFGLEHNLNITLAMTTFRRQILEFIND